MKQISITRVGSESAREVLDLVGKLLRELGEEGDEAGALDVSELEAAWRRNEAHHCAFLARGEDGGAVGVATLSTAFALYASGGYGVINEMWVAPGRRSEGVGARLIEAVKAHGRQQGWQRIDVTAPESEQWARTRRFYERQGFEFTGPKLKYRLSR